MKNCCCHHQQQQTHRKRETNCDRTGKSKDRYNNNLTLNSNKIYDLWWHKFPIEYKWNDVRFFSLAPCSKFICCWMAATIKCALFLPLQFFSFIYVKSIWMALEWSACSLFMCKIWTQSEKMRLKVEWFFISLVFGIRQKLFFCAHFQVGSSHKCIFLIKSLVLLRKKSYSNQIKSV